MTNITNSKNTAAPTGASSIIRGILGGIVSFAVCILLIPLVLSKTETPENYISTAAVITVSLTAFVSALAANSGRCGFIITGTLTSLAIILILVCLSVIFGKSEADKNFLFSAILYAASFIFAIFGAKLSSKKKTSSKRRHKKRR